MGEWAWSEIRESLVLVLMVIVAGAAVIAAWYAGRSAAAAVNSARTTERALSLDIERLERLRDDEEAARKPNVVVELVRTAPGLESASYAKAVLRNAGGSLATAINVRLADLKQGIEFSGTAFAIGASGQAEVPCLRTAGAAGLPSGDGWVAALMWRDEAGEQGGDANAWRSVRYEQPSPPAVPPRATLQH